MSGIRPWAVAGMGMAGLMAVLGLGVASPATASMNGAARVAAPNEPAARPGISFGPKRDSIVTRSSASALKGMARTGAVAMSSSHGVTADLESENWSGLAGTGSDSTTRIWGAEGNWKVPGITRQTALPEYSATWVGVDGLTNSNLIQTGTSENTNNAQDPMPGDHAPYFAWFEILPDPEDTIVYADGHYRGLPVTVKPGDKIFAGVDRVGSDYWQIFIEDTTGHYEDRHGWVFNQDFSYYGQHSSAEWIQEAPTVDGYQSTIAHFHRVKFTGMGYTSNDKTWYSTDMTGRNKIALVVPAGTGWKVQAAPNQPSKASNKGQQFTDFYK